MNTQSYKLPEQPELFFNPETHVYLANGMELPSVTTVLKNVGIVNTRFYTKAGTEKGTNVHLLLEYLDKDTLDWEEVTDSGLEHIQNWERFKAEYEVKILNIETPLYHPLIRFAGTIDRFAIVSGLPAVIDIKSGAYAKWHELQITFYAMIVSYLLNMPVEKYLVYTKKYKVRHVEKNLIPVCEAILRVEKWKREK